MLEIELMSRVIGAFFVHDPYNINCSGLLVPTSLQAPLRGVRVYTFRVANTCLRFRRDWKEASYRAYTGRKFMTFAHRLAKTLWG